MVGQGKGRVAAVAVRCAFDAISKAGRDSISTVTSSAQTTIRFQNRSVLGFGLIRTPDRQCTKIRAVAQHLHGDVPYIINNRISRTNR